MTINEVIEAGVYPTMKYLPSFIRLIIIIVVAIGFSMFTDRRRKKSKNDTKSPRTYKAVRRYEYLTALILVGGLVTITVDYIILDNRETKFINKWKQDVVEPYINNLPDETRGIAGLQIDTQIRNTQEESKVPLTIVYKEGDRLLTLSGVYKVVAVLDDKTPPYMLYKDVKEDLGKGYTKGKYNITIYVPKNYSFN